MASYAVANNAAADWGGLDATLTNTSSSIDYHATNENRGNTVDWSGITRKHGTVESSPPCVSGHWTSGTMDVVINWTLVENAGYGNPKKTMVLAHEMGHAFGLAHTPNHPEWLMYPYDDARTTKVPASHDKAGVNALY